MKKRIFYSLCAGCLFLAVSFFGRSFAQSPDVCTKPQFSPRDSVHWNDWSPAERRVYAKMGRMVAKYVKSVDGNLIFELSEEKFRTLNLPDTMYRRCAEDLTVTNRWLDTKKMPAAERVVFCDDYVEMMAQFVVSFDAYCKAKGFSTDWNKEP